MTATAESTRIAQTARTTVRRVTMRDQDEFTRLATASSDLHRPWVHVPTTPEAFGRYVSRFGEGPAQGLLVCDSLTAAIVGFINLNEVVLGPYQRGLLGYGAFAPHAGRGYLSEGLRAVIGYAFDELGLHRLEADIQPGNQRSRKLVQKLGFRCEGVSAGFILLDGEWTDHERWALTEEMPRPDVQLARA